MFPVPVIINAARAASPSAIAVAAQYVSTAAGVAVKGLNGFINWVKNNPGSAAVAVAGLVTAGIPVDDIADENTQNAAGQGPNGARLLMALRALETKVRATLDKGADVKLGATGDTAELLLLRQMVQFFRVRMGFQPNEMRELHMMLRSFIEIDSATLDKAVLLFATR